VAFKILLLLLSFSFSFSKNIKNTQSIMLIPIDINYSNDKESSISIDFFDEMNSAVLDANIFYKKSNIKSSLFLKQSLLPNISSQKTISKFYNNDSNISYLKKVSDYYDLDILVFMKAKIKKSKLKMSVYVYKAKNKKIKKHIQSVNFDDSSYSLNEKSISRIKNKLVKLIIE